MPDRVDPIKIGGIIVASALALIFLFAAASVLVNANEPPLLADPAPSSPPVLLCPSASAPASTSQASPTGQKSAGAPKSAPGVTSGTPTGTGTTPATPAAGSTSATGQGATLSTSCAPGQAYYAPQYRGAYDPHTRIMALLAVVVPLITTIVAFFFGQRAGAGAAEAEKQKIRAQVLATPPTDAAKVSELHEWIKNRE